MKKQKGQITPRDTQRAIEEVRGIASAGRSSVVSRGKPVSLEGASFEEILSALLKIKPKKK